MDRFIKAQVNTKRIAEVEFHNGLEAGVRLLEKKLLKGSTDLSQKDFIRLTSKALIEEINQPKKYGL